MDDNFNQMPIKRFLLSLVNNDDNIPLERKIFHELTKDITDEKHLYLLAKKAVQKTKSNNLQSFRDVDGLVQYLLELSRKTHSLGFVSTSDRIINLLVEDDNLLTQTYDDIAEFLKDLYGNEDKARVVLEKVYKVLQKEMESRKPFSVTDEDGTMKICNPNSKTMVRLGYVILDVLGDKIYANQVVSYSEKYAISFDDFIEIGDYYARYDESRAIIFFKKAEEVMDGFDFEQAWGLCHSLWHMKNGDRDFAMEQMVKAIKMAKCSEDYVRLAECCGATDGISDKQLCLLIFQVAQSKAVNSSELESIKSSLALVNEDWETERNEANE